MSLLGRPSHPARRARRPKTNPHALLRSRAMAAEVVDLFLELAALPSPPGDERAVADVVTRYLRDLGLSVEEDDAGEKVGSNMGNLFCRVEPNGGGTPIFLCAHLDTVPPESPTSSLGVNRSSRPPCGPFSPRAGRTGASSSCSRPRRRSGSWAPPPSTTSAFVRTWAMCTTRPRRSET